MTGVTEAVEGIVALVFGGFFFIVVGSAVTTSTASAPLLDLQFWGVLYILAAIVLAVGVVYAAILSILH